MEQCFEDHKQFLEYKNYLSLRYICGLYYKHVTIVNDGSSIVSN
jgi:hypothetical protein